MPYSVFVFLEIFNGFIVFHIGNDFEHFFGIGFDCFFEVSNDVFDSFDLFLDFIVYSFFIFFVLLIGHVFVIPNCEYDFLVRHCSAIVS